MTRGHAYIRISGNARRFIRGSFGSRTIDPLVWKHHFRIDPKVSKQDEAMVEISGQWPTELRLKDQGRVLQVRYESGATFDLTAEYLRVTSPSAEVQGHSEEERVTVAGKRNCSIIGIEEVGTYAVRLTFDDLHSTGIYTWDYLYELGSRHGEKWAFYEAELQAKGLDRDRAGQR